MNCSPQQGLSNCITSMLNSLSTIGSELCELNLHVPIPFPGHLNARFITSKLFTAMSMYKSSISKASHHCRKCHSTQLLSDSSMKGQPTTPPFLFMDLSDYLWSQHVQQRELGHSLPHVRSLCISNAGRAEPVSTAAESFLDIFIKLIGLRRQEVSQ